MQSDLLTFCAFLRSKNSDELKHYIFKQKGKIFEAAKNTDTITELRDLCPQVKEFVSLSAENDDDRVTSFKETVREHKGEMITAVTSSDTLAAIFFTSGTTGKSKGVMLTHGKLYHNTVSSIRKTHPQKNLANPPKTRYN